MGSSRTIAVIAVSFLALAAGCESTPLTAPSEGQIVMSAVPATITLEEFAVPAVTEDTTTITAQVLDANGIPQSGVGVIFTTDGGVLASSALPDPALKTDDGGRVSDTLTVALGDPDAITVTARSGPVSTDFPFVKTEVGLNQPPFPVIDIRPANQARFDDLVIYDGSISDDPDGDPITCYQWEIETGKNITPDLPCSPPSSRCEIVQGLATARMVDRTYEGDSIADEQRIDVTLRVSDNPAIACPTDSVTPVSEFNAITFATYEIVCDPTDPIASVSPSSLPLTVDASGQVTAVFSSTGSRDPESGIAAIDGYEWNCGNGAALQDTPSASCTFTNTGTTSVPFTVTLTVTNGCGMFTQATASVLVAPL